MKKKLSLYAKMILPLFMLLAMSSFFSESPSSLIKPFKFPYKQAGLTNREAAAHLLNRFTYGATPNQVDEVVQMGLEQWFSKQLDASLPDDTLKGRLEEYDALNLTNAQIAESFPRQPKVLKMAIAEGYIDKDSVDKGDKKSYKKKLDEFMKLKGYREESELFRQFINQKILRAVYSDNQLQEVMTDFWFNHFNVSITKNDCAQFIPSYERDVIRPNVFGKFQTLLTATAKSPAMLLYLDNFTSAGNNDGFDNFQPNNQKRKFINSMKDTGTPQGKLVAQKVQQAKKGGGGLNENYAREIMELHTLGVDGGYTQTDVTQAARVLTGWTIYPFADYGPAANMKKAIERFGEDKLKERGFMHEGDFLFAINRHDDREKTVLGKKFKAGGGYDEGVELLTMLSHHASTAKFICKKLAVRFVNDNPPQSLIDKMAKTFLENDGDIKQVLIAMASAPEFWSKAALREKTKSPFELAISSVRSLDADVLFPFQLNNWITRMGQKMYFYQAPTGFPDKGQYWINTGSLLNRMNFGLALASKKIPGIKFDLAELNNHKEPESAEAALKIYCKLLMPERNVDATIKRLTPLLSDPNFTKKITEAATKTSGANDKNGSDDLAMEGKISKERVSKRNTFRSKDFASMQASFGDNSMLSQVVGIIIGSPEYQRR
jgi:uncharacterized protein (DUF1800 family)